MLVFPQLMSGAVAQYPLEKRRRTRSTMVRTEGGSWYTRHDAGADAVEWTLHYADLDPEQAERLETFFAEAEGRLRTFLFVDPLANLLRWSGDLTQGVWETGMTGVAASAQTDPRGGQEAFVLTNGSAGQTGIAQTVAGPAGYRYAGSVWVRGAVGSKVWLRLGETAAEFAVSGQWRRCQMTALVSGVAGVRWALELGPGGTCEVFGPQLEAQRAAGGYQASGGESAVYSSARFDQDELEWVVEGPEQIGTRVRIRSRS
jgi:hypothetical protein